MDDQIRRILAKLEKARKKELKCFGSEHHGFRLNPPLSDGEITEFEQKHRISLPSDYREFLLRAGNGGAGPYYGISPLSEWYTWFELEEEDFVESPDLSPKEALQMYYENFLSADSPLVYEELIADDWRKKLPADWIECGYGSIHLCNQGCTYSARLIVTGKSKGRVVYFDVDNPVSNLPYFIKDENFLDWYERWLDNVIAKKKTFWFGMDNPDYREMNKDTVKGHPEGKELEYVVHPSLLQTKKKDTLIERLPFLKLRRLSKMVLDINNTSVKDRRNAAYELGKTKKRKAIPILIKALADPDRYVRVYAIQSLGDLGAKEAVPALIAILEETEDDLTLTNVISVFSIIGDRSAIPALVRATSHQDDFARYDAARVLGELGEKDDKEVLAALLKLVNDSTMPKKEYEGGGGKYTVCSVGEMAKRSIEKIRSKE
ncbi:MAG: HEAT repeat domain-containing protein [Candidatus Odinarchaeota archaeon]